MKTYLILLFFILFPMIVISEESSCTKYSCFDPKENFNNVDLIVAGKADYEYLFFKVYSAALYVEGRYKDVDKFNVLDGDSNAILLLKYHRSISGKDLCDSTKYYMEKSKLYSDKLVEPINELCNSYEDVNAGDTYSLNYDKLTRKSCLLKNNIEKYCTNGLDFFKSYAGIWLSEAGVSEEFAKKLNGR